MQSAEWEASGPWPISLMRAPQFLHPLASNCGTGRGPWTEVGAAPATLEYPFGSPSPTSEPLDRTQ